MNTKSKELENYQKWLVSYENKKEGSAKSYKGAIPKLEDHYKQFTGKEVVFEDLSSSELKLIHKKYKQDGQYADFGGKSNGTYRNALNAFIRYMEWKQGGNKDRVITKIKGLFQTEPYQRILIEEEFYFDKLTTLFKQYRSFDTSLIENDVRNLLNNLTTDGGFSFQRVLDTTEGLLKDYLQLIGYMIAIFDDKGYNKNKWNPYEDKRTVARGMFRQHLWTKYFLEYTLNKFSNEFINSTPIAFKNSINFIQSPQRYINIVSQVHIDKILVLFDVLVLEDLFEVFEKELGNISNLQNRGVIISMLLYNPIIRKEWEVKKIVPVEKEMISNEFNKEQIKTKAMNQILYGPPGTGKTYRTKKLAVELIDKTTYGDTEEDRANILERYNELTEQNQIVFTTFHQSMSYEDFVEGIKPKTENKNVVYEVEDGLFKRMANKAKGIKGEISSTDAAIDFKKVSYFKMSVGGKNRKDIHDWCIENNYIALGYGTTNDLTSIIRGYDEGGFRKEYEKQFFVEGQHSSYSITAVAAFNYWMKKGDIVLISLGNHIIDAIGVVTGDYEYMDIDEVPYHHFRKVKWLATNLDADPSLFVDKNISQQTIYEFSNDDIKVDYLEQTFGEKTIAAEKIKKDHVLIIDEINRGNVSAIFGELITLLEPDKRLGEKEALTVTLPYSKSEFGVPANLHIIGTMNTADRSVEALDTALRRRFEFTEVMPDASVLENKVVEEINFKKLLETINERIEILLDRDHTIGHSYFIGVTTEEELKNVFRNKIIPLLQEYFYGDYGKIGLVLGKGFVKKKEKESENTKFADFSYEGQNDFIKESYELNKMGKDFSIIKALDTLGIPKNIKVVEKETEPSMS